MSKKPEQELVARPLQRPQKRFFSLSDEEGVRALGDKGRSASTAGTA